MSTKTSTESTPEEELLMKNTPPQDNIALFSDETRDKQQLTPNGAENRDLDMEDIKLEVIPQSSTQTEALQPPKAPLTKLLTKNNTQRRLMRFLNAADAAPPMEIEFSNMCAKVPTKPGSSELKFILKHVSGKIKHGKFVALMGPSGAGKSTLLNVLGGRFDGICSGNVLINGLPRSNRFKKHIGYVLQTDIMMPNLTVRETLEVTARLRLPSSMSLERKIQRVDDIIHVMGLTKCEDTLVQSVSGGEKKRVSVANEMLINPSILFLDEPTSGLDSTSAFAILSTLQELCKQGRTVICAIHQPSSQMFRKFDQLLLLAASEVVYFGNTTNCTDYFAEVGHPCPIHYNPADFLLEMVTESFESDDSLFQNKAELTKHLLQAWKKLGGAWTAQESEMSPSVDNNESDEKSGNQSAPASRRSSVNPGTPSDMMDDSKVNLIADDHDQHQIVNVSFAKPRPQRVISMSVDPTYETDFTSKWATSWIEQFVILWSRAFKHRRGNNISKQKTFEIIMICLIGGSIWWRMDRTEENLQDWIGATFFVQMYIGFMTMFRGVVYFPTERSVIKKERQSGAYRMSSYYTSKILAEFPVDILLPMVAVTGFYWMVGLNDSVLVFFLYMLITCLGIWTANSFGTMLGCAFMDFERAIAGLAVIGLLFMLIGGYYVKDRAIPVWMDWLKYFSFMRYTYNATLIIIAKNLRFDCGNPSTFEFCESNERTFISGDDVLDVYRYNSEVWFGVVLLFAQSVLYYSVAFLFLRRNTATKHSIPKTDNDSSDNNNESSDERVTLKTNDSSHNRNSVSHSLSE